MNAPLTLIDAVEDMVAQKRTVGYKYELENHRQNSVSTRNQRLAAISSFYT